MAQHIFTGLGAPVTTPSAYGQHYIDTTNKVHYFSVGTSSAADWSTTSSDGIYNDEKARDAIAAAFAAGVQDGISITYNDPADSFSFTNTDKGSTAVSTHVGLTDAHPQYFNKDGTKAMTGSLNMGSNAITSVSAINTTSSTELSYLVGVTSNIQTQLNSKQATGSYITELTGDVTATGPGSVAATLSLTGVDAGTYDRVTVDTKGRVTAAQVLNYAYRTSTTHTNSTVTYTTVSELTSVSLAIGLYRFTFNGLMQATAVNSGGIGIRLSNETAVLSTTYAQWFLSQGNDGVDKYFNYDQLSPTTNNTSASVQTANTDAAFAGNGIFRVTTAGTVAIQIRSETGGTTVTLQPDAVFTIERIA